jgi:hypothetical protein
MNSEFLTLWHARVEKSINDHTQPTTSRLDFATALNLLDEKEEVITRLTKALVDFTDAEFYVKEKPVGKKPGLAFTCAELQAKAIKALQEVEEITR